jgi:HAD superfamily hydrolase (TIGR01490 family)
MNLCLFDLDDTLIPLDSDHAWGEFMIHLGWVQAQEFQRGIDGFFAQYKAGALDIHAYIAFVTQPLQSRSVETLQVAQRQFMEHIILPQIHPAALTLVQHHLQQNDRVALVTATNEFVTTPIAQALGIEHLLAVRLEKDPQGRPTGRIDGVPTYREGKVERVTQWLLEESLNWDDFERISVYSDSPNDLPLLERATHPVATNPTAQLATIAVQRGWPVLKLFS